MLFWVKSAAAIIADRASQRLGVTLLRLLLWVGAATALAIGVGFLFAAAFKTIGDAYGVLVAQLASAAVFLLIAAVLAIVASQIGKRRSQPPTVVTGPDGNIVIPQTAALSTLLAAFAIGFVSAIGRRPARQTGIDSKDKGSPE